MTAPIFRDRRLWGYRCVECNRSKALHLFGRMPRKGFHASAAPAVCKCCAKGKDYASKLIAARRSAAEGATR